ncbi:Pkinase domain-containing protein [Cephalotus follicularis]|uniref:mitogen-activated protein kinase kinase kinase n=1 Tax=Cephalotus follicularis TaxID=3775 RepID=A0A1Q3CCC9_CEPFO|nr:Pkinase domain-containing protein [Cephalotus follicularis]
MSYFKNPFSSSSLPSSPSATNDGGNAGNSVNHRGQSFIRRRLTRQRKLRHVSDDEIGLPLNGPTSYSSPASPRNPRSPAESEHWSASAVPKPLPLPELFLIRKRQSTGPNSGHGYLGSPEEGRSSTKGRKSVDLGVIDSVKAKGNQYRRCSQDVNAQSVNYEIRVGVLAGSPPRNNFLSVYDSPRRSNGADMFPSCSPTSKTKISSNFPKDLSQDLTNENVSCNFEQNVTPKSAPTSSFPSPSVSPRRSKTGDHPSSVGNHEQAWSPFEVSDLGRPTGCTSPVKNVCSPDHSPRHNLTLRSHLNPRSPCKFSFLVHNKLNPENFKDQPDGYSHVHAHPLPLPPGALAASHASAPSPSAVVHHITEKPNASPMKSQWQKGKLIGRGTFGSVYVAANRETGALCAMKEVDIIPDDPKSAECIKQLQQEINVLCRLKHPNIVQYYGSQVVDDRFCIYLEYVHPGSINRYVREHCGVMTESIVRNFTRHILSGLAYLHSKKTIHRDIKGANLLVDNLGVVKLADFGLAKHLTGLSYELSLKGSPYWMAPEVMQAVMQKNSNPDLALAVDIWSLGCTVIEMLNGKPPWSELEGPQAMYKVLNKTPPIPETLSSEGKDFLHCCFQRDPAERPPAITLLEHPFLQNSNEQKVSVCLQAFSKMNLTDQSHSSRDSATHMRDLMPNSAATRIVNGKLPWSCKMRQHCYASTSNCAAASHHSPSSTLEAFPSLN